MKKIIKYNILLLSLFIAGSFISFNNKEELPLIATDIAIKIASDVTIENEEDKEIG